MAFKCEAALNENDQAHGDAGSTCGLHRRRESELVAAAKRGQAAAFDELWQSHARRLLRTTNRITKNREDAEDSLQDALLNAFVHMKDFDGRSSFSTWLTRIAINSALMIVRKKRSPLELTIADLGDRSGEFKLTDVPDRAPNPEVHYSRRERGEILRSAIRALKPKTRGALELQKLQEYSVKETARMMGISVTAAKSQLFYAKAALRKSLKPEMLGHARATGQLHFQPAE